MLLYGASRLTDGSIRIRVTMASQVLEEDFRSRSAALVFGQTKNLASLRAHRIFCGSFFHLPAFRPIWANFERLAESYFLVRFDAWVVGTLTDSSMAGSVCGSDLYEAIGIAQAAGHNIG